MAGSLRLFGLLLLSSLMGLRPGLRSAVPVRQAQGRLYGTRFSQLREEQGCQSIVTSEDPAELWPAGVNQMPEHEREANEE
jgi:hypothetical protein